MNAAGRLGAYATGLAVIFAASFAAAGAVVPEETVADWTQQAQEAVKNHPADPGRTPAQDPADTAADGHDDH
ncbi:MULTISPECIES: hypothetical protein [Kocuria]|uniref:Uncharacterized protein n=1 Tax=Kocuria marina subsp. indica TaxID=1049583 RepID=A0A1X7DIY5_9MICC|nr:MULTISPECIES: hypothetical protein [Kocuria]MDT0119013.1 hypothetical protein [Kocuria sp. PD6]SMF16398.1 hypothetical protein SAMN06296028_11255 [Kocuria indica]